MSAVRETAGRIEESAARIHAERCPQAERTFLHQLLIIAPGTGRRITPISRLLWSNIWWGKSTTRPPGTIVRPEVTDKQRKAWEAPISARVPWTLEAHRKRCPGVGDAWVFPSPRNAAIPIGKNRPLNWLREAEEMASLEPEACMTWHSIRRAWATARKHHPDADVARAGGWSDTRSLQLWYQAADEETTLRVVLDAARLEKAQ